MVSLNAIPSNIFLFGAATLAGAINSVAGGGTLITYPALLWAGQPPIIANATSTVAVWPGDLFSLWGYRREMESNPVAIIGLVIPSILGGFAGAYLLVHTSPALFSHLIPFLVLLATLLFLVQPPLSASLRRRAERSQRAGTANSAGGSRPASLWAGLALFQFAIGIYGGYFGAGIGIMILTALSLLGLTNIHQMNGLKNIGAACINAVAGLLFIVKGYVDLRVALLMVMGAILGGYGGARLAQRVGQQMVRRIVIGIGFTLTAALFLHHS